jgi:hypothetical protein
MTDTMRVVKADGSKEDFDKEKIVKTCLRAGAPEKAARQIADNIVSRLYEGIGTHEIYKMIIEGLDKLEDKSSMLFRLRESVALLDSRVFELYVKKVLEADGFVCQWDQKIHGLFVEHQIDIVARAPMERGGGLMLVECKRHVNPHRYTGLNITLQLQARLEDVEDGFARKKNSFNFDAAWLVTNGKFSEHAKMYAKGKNIRLTGWRHEGDYALERLIHSKNMFPITMLKGTGEIKSLLAKGIITIQDFANSNFSKRKEFSSLWEQAKLFLPEKAKL